MKRSTKLIVALLVVVAALVVIYRLMHRVPSADLEANVQMQQIITDAECTDCIPFRLPIHEEDKDEQPDFGIERL